MRPKVLHIIFEPISHPNGGLGVHVSRVTKHLEQYCDQVILNYPKSEAEFNKRVNIGNGRDSVTIHPFTDYLTTDDSLELHHDQEVYFNAFLDHCNERFDIIHCHDTYFYPLASKLRRLHGSKVVVTSHLILADVLSLYEAKPGSFVYRNKWKHMMETEIKAYHEADKVITISQHYRSFLTELMMVPEKSIKLVYNGVDHSPVVASPRSEPEVIGFLGRASLMKGCNLLRPIITKHREKKFKIITAATADVQDGYAKDFMDWCNEQPNVDLVNGLHPDKKWDHMAQCDLAIMPSLREPWGLVSLEWQSAGVPLIASNRDGLKETVTEKNGWPTDPMRLEDAFENYSYDHNRVENALEFSRQFQWSKCADQVWEVYKCLVHSA